MSDFISFSNTEIKPNLDEVHDVFPEEVNEKKGQITVVDVRTPEEYTGELGHIPGSRLIPLDTLMDHIQDLKQHQTLVFVCRSGGRSAKATAIAMEQGFGSVYNMKGGMLLWNQMSLETEGVHS